jgi:cytosine/adenosine deaminase-related metal-dependent hydrolase
VIRDGAVYFSGDKIGEVGEYHTLKNRHPESEIVGNGKQLLMPGLIDGHSHGGGLTFIQCGMPYDYLENVLFDWAFMPGIEPEINATLSAVRHLRNGCTTMHHNNWSEEPNLAENAEKKIQGYMKTGIRLAYSPGGRNVNTLALDDEDFYKTLPSDLQEFAAPMVFNDKELIVKKYLELFDYLYEKYNGENIRIILGPSWVQGSTDDFLTRVKQKAEELGKVQIHIHTLQSPVQKAYGKKKYGKSLLAHLDDLGLVDKNLTLGHAVFLTQEDIELLAQKGASTTHHPSCNFAVRNGISPVYALLKRGVNVAIGIDDKGINDDEDIIMELKLAYNLHRVSGFDLKRTPALSPWDILGVGTVNGAKVCGYQGEVGELRPGMCADAVLVDLDEILHEPWVSPNANIGNLFMHRAKGTHVNTVIVNGRVVMKERKFLTVDVDSLYDEVRKEASRGITPEQKAFAGKLQKIKSYCQKWYEGWENIDYQPFYLMNSEV